MRTIISLIALGVLMVACQKPQEDPRFHDGIVWTGDNEIANYMAMEGIGHWMNIELEKAYVLFDEAVELDSSLFACHTAMAMLNSGEKREYHKMMAKKFVEGKNEASKLFVSLLDIENDSTAREKRAAVWAKMHELSNGPFIHFRYAQSRADTLEALQEMEKLEVQLNEYGMETAHIYNMKGYLKNLLGDLEGGTKDIEKYMALYPEGYNPLDSRAEFYLFAGDTSAAIGYYKKAQNKFRYASSARNRLADLEKK